jgi:hypothetical protein
MNIISSEETIKNREKDYKTMQESMFYGSSISFVKLIERITEFNNRIKKS